MFDYEKIQRLNQLELMIMKYVLAHKQKVEKMTIRKLADEVHVSTSTILRFCERLDYEGFSEFKYALKQDRLNAEKDYVVDYDVLVPVNDFLNKSNNDDFRTLLDSATQLIVASQSVFFFGLGTSGALAQYGSRYLANTGVFALTITDPFMPFGSHEQIIKHSLLVVLSVSGETEEMLMRVQQFKAGHGKILAITNSTKSTLAQIADITIPYYMPEERNGSLNNTTQIPAVYILELLTHRVAEKLQSRKTAYRH